MFGFRAAGQDKLLLPAKPNHCLLTAWLSPPPPPALELASSRACASCPTHSDEHPVAAVTATGDRPVGNGSPSLGLALLPAR